MPFKNANQISNNINDRFEKNDKIIFFSKPSNIFGEFTKKINNNIFGKSENKELNNQFYLFSNLFSKQKE